MDQEILKRVHQIEVEILDEIDRICKNNGIEYYLIAGTLLGAVRHQGFIPWDDDLDIAMNRENYIKFLQCCEKELDSRYALQWQKTEPLYFKSIAKIRKKGTLYEESKMSSKLREKGIWVDIFPLDYSRGCNVASEKIKRSILLYIRKIEQIRVGRIHDDRYSASRKQRLCIKVCDLLRISNKSLLDLTDKISASTKNGSYYMNHGSQYGEIKQTMPISYYEPATKIQFEGKFYCAPNNYDAVLRQLYGDDYMELPPLEKRICHNPIAVSFDTSDERNTIRFSK